MAGTTTYYGISYPTSTDYVKDGATAMQTIATGFDSAVAIPTYNNQTGTTYTFVLADAGKTVTSNNASAVTFTIPPQSSVTWADGTTLTVRNLGAGVVTIAGGAGVTVTNTAQIVSQYGEIKIIRTASNAWTVTPSGGKNGLVLIETKSFTTQSAVQFDNCFTSTYDNYLAVVTISAASSNGEMRFRWVDGTTPITATGHYFAQSGIYTSSGSAVVAYSGGGSGITYNVIGDIITSAPQRYACKVTIYGPQLAQLSRYTSEGQGQNATGLYHFNGSGYIDASTQYEGIQFYNSAGTISGTISVYGFEK